ARIERVGQAALEAAHPQAVEPDLHALTDRARRGRAQRERTPHVPRPIGMARRIAEKPVPPAAAFPGLALIERTGAADDRLTLEPDGRDERLFGIERERRAP